MTSYRTIYVLLGDPREHGGVLLVTENYKEAMKRARSYIIGHNRDRMNEWIAPKTRRMSDKRFLRKYWSAWITSPSIYRRRIKIS